MTPPRPPRPSQRSTPSPAVKPPSHNARANPYALNPNSEVVDPRWLLKALALLLLISIPIATGTLDATQKAGTKQSTLRLVTTTPILPNATPSTGQFTYTNYVLLRESDTRYWLFRIGDQYAYSIAKSQVLYIRY